MRVGILGGTFDPIHNAHLFIAEDTAAHVGLTRVLIIPNAVPPHKPSVVVAEAAHRLCMVELAVEGSDLLQADPMEIARGGPSYTVDTLRELHRRLPGDEFYFIAGLDAIAEIGTWREPDEVARLCTLVAVSRPGTDMETVRRTVPERLFKCITLHTVPELGISATMIRERVRQGLPIRHLTPDPVVRYIEEQRLYR